MKVCAESGCPNLTDSTRCEFHSKAKRRREDQRRPSAKARGYDSKWERTRRLYLRSHPICEDPEGCIDRSTDVDHIDGLGPLGPKGHDEENLRALCHSHHSKRTARDQPGGWHAMSGVGWPE